MLIHKHIHTDTHIPTYTHIHIPSHRKIDTHLHAYLPTTYTILHKPKQIYTQDYTDSHTHIYQFTNTRTNVNLYTHIYTHSHILTHIQYTHIITENTESHIHTYIAFGWRIFVENLVVKLFGGHFFGQKLVAVFPPKTFG